MAPTRAVMDLTAALAALTPPPGSDAGWDEDAATAALAWLAARGDRAQVTAAVAAMDRRPSHWLRHPDLALRAAVMLRDAGGAELPRFLVVTAEDGYRCERGAAEPGGNPLMDVRRELEARRLIAAIEAIQRGGVPGELFAAVEPPEPLDGDSAAHMAARILERVEAIAPAHLAGLEQHASGWLADAVARHGERAGRRAIDALLARRDARSWSAIVAEAPAVIAAHADDEAGYVALIMAHRWLEQDAEAEAVARAGLRALPGRLAILHAALPALLRGRAAAAIELWTAVDAARSAPIADADRAMLGDVVANVIVACCATGRAGDGARALAPYIDGLDAALMLGNAACMYALAGDVPAALRAVERALAAGQPASFFATDPDLDSLRGLPELDALLAAAPPDWDWASDSDSNDGGGDIEAIRQQLGSPDRDEIRAGLRALRAWVEAAGCGADLSRFGVPPSDEELVASEPFDTIVERDGFELGKDGLLDLVASLFNGNTAYHGTAAAIAAARLLVATGDEAAELALVDIYRAACACYDDGHRHHGASGMDLFIDEILAACHGAALARLMIWACRSHYTRDLGDLLEPALVRASASDAAEILTTLDASLRDDDGALMTHGLPDAIARMDACRERLDLAAPARQRLELLRAEAAAELATAALVEQRLASESASDLAWLLTEVGAAVPAHALARRQRDVEIGLARHLLDLPVDTLLGSLRVLPATSPLFPALARLAVERDPARAAAVLADLLAGAAAATRDALIAANQPALFTELRRAARRRDVWTALPREPHPALTALLAATLRR